MKQYCFTTREPAGQAAESSEFFSEIIEIRNRLINPLHCFYAANRICGGFLYLHVEAITIFFGICRPEVARE